MSDSRTSLPHPRADRSQRRSSRFLVGATAWLLAASSVVVALLGAGGCASSPPSAYQSETFSLESSFSRHFGESIERTCDAARRALLSQGYVVSELRTGSITGRKMFQPLAESHIQIDFTVSCVGGRRAVNGATAFVSAVQERYALKKTPTSASVGSPVGTISLPFGSSSDAMIRIASETIASNTFYARFFALMEHYLVHADEDDAPEPPEPIDLPANQTLEPG